MALLHWVQAGWHNIVYWVREYMGENDYQRYKQQWLVAHLDGFCGPQHDHDNGKPQAHHNNMMSEREYYQYKLDIRYNPTMQRC